MAMAMESLDVGGQTVGQSVAADAEARAWGAGVVEQGLHLAVFGVDAQSDAAPPPYPMVQPLVLRERVERQVAGAVGYLVDLVVGVGWREGVCLRPELLHGQSGLAERACRGGADVLAEDGERLPQGKGLEGQDDLHVGLSCHLADELQVASEPLFLYDVNWCCHVCLFVFLCKCTHKKLHGQTFFGKNRRYPTASPHSPYGKPQVCLRQSRNYPPSSFLLPRSSFLEKKNSQLRQIVLAEVLAARRQLMAAERGQHLLELQEEALAGGVAVGVHVERS